MAVRLFYTLSNYLHQCCLTYTPWPRCPLNQASCSPKPHFFPLLFAPVSFRLESRVSFFYFNLSEHSVKICKYCISLISPGGWAGVLHVYPSSIPWADIWESLISRVGIFWLEQGTSWCHLVLSIALLWRVVSESLIMVWFWGINLWPLSSTRALCSYVSCCILCFLMSRVATWSHPPTLPVIRRFSRTRGSALFVRKRPDIASSSL